MPLLFLCQLSKNLRVSSERWLLALQLEMTRQTWKSRAGEGLQINSSQKPAPVRIYEMNYQTNQSSQKLKTPTFILLITMFGRIKNQSLYLFESYSRRISYSQLYSIDRFFRSQFYIQFRINTGYSHKLNINLAPYLVRISNIQPTHSFTILQLGFITSAQKSRNYSLMDQGRMLTQRKYLTRREESQCAIQLLDLISLEGLKFPMWLQPLILFQRGNWYFLVTFSQEFEFTNYESSILLTTRECSCYSFCLHSVSFFPCLSCSAINRLNQRCNVYLLISASQSSMTCRSSLNFLFGFFLIYCCLVCQSYWQFPILQMGNTGFCNLENQQVSKYHPKREAEKELEVHLDFNMAWLTGCELSNFQTYFSGKYQLGLSQPVEFQSNPNIKHSSFHFRIKHIPCQINFPLLNNLLTVRIYFNHIWHSLHLDTSLPVINKTPLFGKIKQKIVWSWQLEKAYMICKQGRMLADEVQLALGLGNEIIYCGFLQSQNLWESNQIVALKSVSPNSREYGVIPGCVYKLQQIKKEDQEITYFVKDPTREVQQKKGRHLQQERSQCLVLDRDQLLECFQLYYLILPSPSPFQKIRIQLFPNHSNHFSLQLIQPTRLSLVVEQSSLLEKQGSQVNFSQVVFDLISVDRNQFIGEGCNMSYRGALKVFPTCKPILDLQAGKYLISVGFRNANYDRIHSLAAIAEKYNFNLEREEFRNVMKVRQRALKRAGSVHQPVWMKHRCVILVQNELGRRASLKVNLQRAQNLSLQDYNSQIEFLQGYQYLPVAFIKQDLTLTSKLEFQLLWN